jgi:hypothetical protein
MLIHPPFLCIFRESPELAIPCQPETNTISSPHIDYIAKIGATDRCQIAAMCFIVHDGGSSADESHAHSTSGDIVNVETRGTTGEP